MDSILFGRYPTRCFLKSYHRSRKCARGPPRARRAARASWRARPGGPGCDMRCDHRGVKNGGKIVITQHSVPELIPTPAASRLIGSGYAPLQHTQSACLWALGLTSLLRSARAQPAHGGPACARALLAHASLCTTSSRAAATARQCDRHNTQQAGLRSSHFAPLARSLLIISSSPRRSMPPSRRTIPCSSYIMAIRSLGRLVAPRPHMARPPPADSARGRRRGRIHAFLCHIGQVTSGQSWPVPYGASVPGHTRTTRTQGQGAASGSAGREE